MRIKFTKEVGFEFVSTLSMYCTDYCELDDGSIEIEADSPMIAKSIEGFDNVVVGDMLVVSPKLVSESGPDTAAVVVAAAEPVIRSLITETEKEILAIDEVIHVDIDQYYIRAFTIPLEVSGVGTIDHNLGRYQISIDTDEMTFQVKALDHTVNGMMHPRHLNNMWSFDEYGISANEDIINSDWVGAIGYIVNALIEDTDTYPATMWPEV